MRRFIAEDAASIGAAIVIAAVILACAWCAFADISSATDITFHQRKQDGTQILRWDWEASASGTDSARTNDKVYGVLLRGYSWPDATATMSSTTPTLAVKEVYDPGGGVAAVMANTDVLSGGWTILPTTSTLSPKAFWPTTVVPVGSQLQLEVSGASANSTGSIALVVSPAMGAGS